MASQIGSEWSPPVEFQGWWQPGSWALLCNPDHRKVFLLQAQLRVLLSPLRYQRHRRHWTRLQQPLLGSSLVYLLFLGFCWTSFGQPSTLQAVFRFLRWGRISFSDWGCGALGLSWSYPFASSLSYLSTSSLAFRGLRNKASPSLVWEIVPETAALWGLELHPLRIHFWEIHRLKLRNRRPRDLSEYLYPPSA